MADKLYKFIKEDAIIDIKISKPFYDRLQYLLIYFFENTDSTPETGSGDPEGAEIYAAKRAERLSKTMKAVEKLRNGGGAESVFEEHIITLTGLLYQLEIDAENQGWMEERPLPKPN